MLRFQFSGLGEATGTMKPEIYEYCQKLYPNDISGWGDCMKTFNGYNAPSQSGSGAISDPNAGTFVNPFAPSTPQGGGGGFVVPFNPFGQTALQPGMPGYCVPGSPGCNLPAPTPWYMAPAGIALLAGAALIAYKLLSD